jgi:hypothetical protein
VENQDTSQPVLVRDARWLMQMAQSPATEDLGAYFEVAKQIAESLPEEDRIEIHSAGVRMAGGHLRSQIRYHSLNKAVSLDEQSLVLSTRNSNALDFALLVQDLVPLLDAYERACQSEGGRTRLELADAICQGVSPDPELFLNRVALLGAYSMIEHLFITTMATGTRRIHQWDAGTLGCSRNTKRGSPACRRRCLTIAHTSGRLPAPILHTECCTASHLISSSTWCSRRCNPMP